jgi:hypothetical protein
MKKTNLILAFALCLAAATQLSAQQGYKSSVGARLGVPLSLSYKQFISEPGAVEVFGGFKSYSGYGWINVGAMYEHHNSIASVDGLAWYFGGGASAYFWNFDFTTDSKTTSFALLGCVGLDYKFANVPVNLSADWVPGFFFNSYTKGFGGGYGALAVRYVLK